MKALGTLIARYSTNQDYRPYDLLTELQQRNLFVLRGQKQIPPITFHQTTDAYIESFHSRNGFSRDRMTPQEAQAFDDAVKHLVLTHHPGTALEMKVTTQVTWGFPTALFQSGSPGVVY